MGTSRELALTVECCRQAFAGVDPAAVERLCREVDWPLFVRTVRFHRVQGLVGRSLHRLGIVPGDVAAALGSDATAISAANLRAAVESRALLEAFEADGVPLMFVKGLTLGALAYGDAMIKSAVDIDLLIDKSDFAEAAEILQRRGYRSASLHAWHGPHKETSWIRDNPRVHVDLHTRLADHPRLIPRLEVTAPAQWVEVADGIRLPTLRFEELFAYLCVHGASSLWFRLKWISDVAALLHSRTAADIERLYLRADELGAGRAAAHALLLADRLFGTLGDAPALRQKLASERSVRWLYRLALREITVRREPAEPTERPLGTIAIHLAQFLLLPGVRFKASEFMRQARVAMSNR